MDQGGERLYDVLSITRVTTRSSDELDFAPLLRSLFALELLNFALIQCRQPFLNSGLDDGKQENADNHQDDFVPQE